MQEMGVSYAEGVGINPPFIIHVSNYDALNNKRHDLLEAHVCLKSKCKYAKSIKSNDFTMHLHI